MGIYNNTTINTTTNNTNTTKPLIIWIDYSIDNAENRAYYEQLENLGIFMGFKSIQNGINEILKKNLKE